MNKPTLLIALIIAAANPNCVALAATQPQIDTARSHALAWLISHQQGDGRWQSAPRLDVQTTATTLLGIEAAGVTVGYARHAGLSWLGNAHAGSVDALARQAAVLGRFGRESDALFAKLTEARFEPRKGWGAYAGYGVSQPDTPVAFEAYRLANATYADAGFTVGVIANLVSAGGTRNTDGGWPYEAPESSGMTGLKPAPSRVIPTTSSIISLARWLPGTLPGFNTNTQISAGINWLLTLTEADNGYTDDPAATAGSPYETALFVLAVRTAAAGGNSTALAAPTVTKLNSAIDRLIATQGVDGAWSGDAYATALALQSFPGVALPDTDVDGVPDESETFLGTNPNLADTKYLAGSSSGAVISIHDAELLTSSPIGSAFSQQLPSQGGTPVAYALVTGLLPAGLFLNSATGLVTGQGTTSGTFNFIYAVTKSNGTSETRAASIVIAEPPLQVPAVPPWGLGLLASLLFMCGLSAQRRRGARSC